MTQDSSIFIETIKVRRLAILPLWLKIYLGVIAVVSIIFILGSTNILLGSRNSSEGQVFFSVGVSICEYVTGIAFFLVALLILAEAKYAIRAMNILIVAKLLVCLFYLYLMLIWTTPFIIVFALIIFPVLLNVIVLIAFARQRNKWENEAVKKSEATGY
ncbi:hypothetical protein DVR12_20900 [Chitinophaga silvatica]|uniref:Uncharacterized protein n=1 Tax=Chitinophaga silvatica TaxID=2282649 RepID=A0A3E1Y610_9BACT|nr:hypothetical protein [Chitinophaga silvatica]RFS20176.1 hypothetical protein DVR12_20900 [Chitinophaga silvatica]